MLLLLTVSCAKKDTDGEQDTFSVGKYVYVDCFKTIHIDRECASELADNPKTKEERLANMQGVKFIDTCNLTKGYRVDPNYWHSNYYEYKYCPKCVDDNAFKLLTEIMVRNEDRSKVTIDWED